MTHNLKNQFDPQLRVINSSICAIVIYLFICINYNFDSLNEGQT